MSTMSWDTQRIQQEKRRFLLVIKKKISDYRTQRKGKTGDNRAVGLFRMSKKKKKAAKVDGYVSKIAVEVR